MGVDLAAYRLVIGAFARIAAHAGVRLGRKAKHKKRNPLRKLGSSDKEETSKSDQVRGRWKSLERDKRNEPGKFVCQRSRSLSQRASRKRACCDDFRRRSPSLVTRSPDKKYDSFKDACVACKTELFDQRWRRGRGRQRNRPKCQRSCEDHHCRFVENGIENETRNPIREAPIHLLLSVAASECLLAEALGVIFTVVQMLLVRAGIETNPGPTTISSTSSPCCKAYQHFRRVKNTIEKAHENFKSKVTDETLTKKVIEIEETGRYVFNQIIQITLSIAK